MGWEAGIGSAMCNDPWSLFGGTRSKAVRQKLCGGGVCACVWAGVVRRGRNKRQDYPGKQEPGYKGAYIS